MILLKTGLVAGLFFAAKATTFGPIPVYKQAENTQYYVRAHISSAPRVEREPDSQRPYTYWDIHVSEQQQGEPLPEQLTIREPGGELGNEGYHVAATAQFVPGEDVFLALRDTSQGGVKEVVGLASGKYSVVPGPDGKPLVRSGLGLPVSGEHNEPLTPDEFNSLLHRIARGQATDADKNVFVSKTVTHDDDIPSAKSNLATRAEDRAPMPAEAVSPAAKSLRSDTAVSPNAVQQKPASSEESSTGTSSWGWLLALGALAGLIAALYIALR